MASSPRKRDLADFFKPYARSRFFPQKTIPQKRPSPQPEDQVDGAREARPVASPRATTPSEDRENMMPTTPRTTLSKSAIPPRSGSLPIRTPRSSAHPAVPLTYKSGRLFATEDRSTDEEPNKSASPSPASEKHLSPDGPRPTTLATSKQSVVREGQVVAIRDSDEDDSDSLASLNDIFGTRKDDDETSSSSPPDLEDEKREAERISTLRLFTNGRSDPLVGKQKMRDIIATRKSRNMNKYMSQQTDYVRTNDHIKQARERYEKILRDLDQGSLSGDLVAKVQQYMGSNGEDTEKLLGAVRRTEALSEELSFSFFRPDSVSEWDRSTGEKMKFPADAIPGNLFGSHDADGRSRAFLSGFMSELADQGLLHDDALAWTFNVFPLEPIVTLRHAYIRCLELGAKHWVRTNVTAADVRSCFEKLGADPKIASLDTRLEATELRRTPTPASSRSRHLLAVLDTFSKISAHMSFEALSMLCSILCRLAIDHELMANSKVAGAVEALFQSLLGGQMDTEAALHVASHLISDVTAHLQEPPLQALLLEHIMPVTMLQCNIRIILAHAFLLGVAAPTSTPDPSMLATVDLTALTTLINTSDDYATAKHRTTLNYTHLRARTLILDVAISNGGLPISFPSSQYSNVRSFNRQVDALAAAIRKATTAIADTGATHMKRTEAKEKLDCVYHRLLYVVRTEPPPKKHIFDQVTGKYGEGDEVRAVERGRGLMEIFLAKVKEDQADGKIKEEKAIKKVQVLSPKSSGGSQIFEDAHETLSSTSA